MASYTSKTFGGAIFGASSFSGDESAFALDSLILLP